MTSEQAQGTREIKYQSLGERDPGDIWANRREGIFVVVSSRPAHWQGEDEDVYGEIDTWYTIRPADEAETALWTEALAATAARRELRARLGAVPSHRFVPAQRQLVSPANYLDSYDDRYQSPKPLDLDDESFAIEHAYVDALAALHGHA